MLPSLNEGYFLSFFFFFFLFGGNTTNSFPEAAICFVSAKALVTRLETKVNECNSHAQKRGGDSEKVIDVLLSSKIFQNPCFAKCITQTTSNFLGFECGG